MHAGPANFALDSQSFAMIFHDGTALAKSRLDLL
jgi:hypothetical protein